MVAVDRDTFLASVPGRAFGSVSAGQVALIDECLAAAGRRTNATFFQSPDLAIDAVCLKAAILLMRHPRAEKLRLTNPEQVFTWEVELEQLQRSATQGLRVF